MSDTKHVKVHNWGHTSPESIEKLGFVRPNPKDEAYSHGLYDVTDDEKWEMMRMIYESGLNVQLLHSNHNREFEIIMINSGKFTQQ